MAEQKPFKYRINHYLSLLPKGLSHSEFAFLIELDYRITRKEFNHDRALRLGNDGIIPDDRLKIYAFMFQITPEQLKNF